MRHQLALGGSLDTQEEKEKNRKKFEKTGSGRRQDHGSRNLTHGRDDSDVSEYLIKANKRRDARHGAEEIDQTEE